MRGISSLVLKALNRVWRGCHMAARHRTLLDGLTIAIPAKAGIQYAATFDHERRWNTGWPAFAGDDTGKADLLAAAR
jgi:hypothetical protein